MAEVGSTTTPQPQRALARLRVLAALGVDVYAARRPLPAAGPTRWFAPQPPVPLVVQQRSDPPPGVQPTGSAATPVRAPQPTAKAPPGRSTAVALRCQVLVWGWRNGMLLLADGAGFGTNRARLNALARLVTDIRAAIEPGRDDAAQFHRFDWPVSQAPGADTSREHALAVFDGFVQQRLGDYASTAVVVLGESCLALLDQVAAPALSHIPRIAAPAPAQLFDDPAHKAELWEALQVLRRPSQA